MRKNLTYIFVCSVLGLSSVQSLATQAPTDSNTAIKVESTEKEQLSQDINAIKSRVRVLIKEMSKPLEEKSYNDWANETTQPIISKMQERKGLPPKPAIKNKFGGYNEGDWLTQKQEEEFLTSKEFKEINDSTRKEYFEFLTKLNNVIGNIQSLANNAQNLTIADVEKINLPKLRALTEKERSFMLSTDIALWDRVNAEYTDKYLKPQLERLSQLASLNVESQELEKMTDRLMGLEKKAIDKLNQAAENLNQKTEETLAASGLVKDASGALVFNPKIDIKIPEIKDFTSNCYLLDDNNAFEEEKAKPEIETKEVTR